MIQHIWVATDGSPPAAIAVTASIQLGQAFPADLTVIAVDYAPDAADSSYCNSLQTQEYCWLGP